MCPSTYPYIKPQPEKGKAKGADDIMSRQAEPLLPAPGEEVPVLPLLPDILLGPLNVNMPAVDLPVLDAPIAGDELAPNGGAAAADGNM